MLDYTIEILEDKILISIKKPEAPNEQLEELNSMKNDLDIYGFIEWVSLLPLDPASEEWAYWEVKSGHWDPWIEQERIVNGMKEELRKIKEEIEKVNKNIQELHTKESRWDETSRIIALETENEKLKNKLEAYEHHKKK